MKIEVESVDRTRVKGPVKIGIGTEQQFGALYDAGADEVKTPQTVQLLMEENDSFFSCVFRAEDTVIMVQPNLLNLLEIKIIGAKVKGFHVPKCGDFELKTDKAIRLFRQLKPDLPDVVRVENRGGAVKYPQPTEAQAAKIIEWWHDTSIKRADVVNKVNDMLGSNIEHHWIRDKVNKWTGSAARNVE